ncbi:MAG: hypothetical protein GY782_09380 [Gammaproteobacteria bacterium]|nr:hypothetical protein [Gammaproteobacteria bacterium]
MSAQILKKFYQLLALFIFQDAKIVVMTIAAQFTVRRGLASFLCGALWRHNLSLIAFREA